MKHYPAAQQSIKSGVNSMQVGRTERRMAMSALAQIEMPPDQPSIIESAAIENISEHGVRVIISRPLRVNDRLIVSDVLGGFRVTAEVVYCQRLADDRFAAGLKFSQVIRETPPQTDD